MSDAGFDHLGRLNPDAVEEALRREEWLHEMWKVLGPDVLPAVETWMIDKDERELEGALTHAMATGKFPPPA